jgi:membrane fusion protein (multidrug efflux system)
MTKPKSKLKLTIIILASLVIIGIASFYWHYTSLHPSTDDAYVNANKVDIVAQVSGPIDKIYVQNEDHVEKGQPLFDILPASFQAILDQAIAQRMQAKNNAIRTADLVKLDYAPKSNLDDVKAALAAAEAAVEQAQLNLTFTKVTAPASGKVVNFNLRAGSTVTANLGLVLFSIIEDSQWWVDANFKETQLERIRPHQKASVQLDIYPDQKWTACVEHIETGSGSVFSLLPAENATGNWVKVTQRFPVKIMLPQSDKNYPFRLGASSSVTVDTTKNNAC